MDFLLRFDNPRPNQDLMMKDIRDAVLQRRSILINAPTGIGKTDGSLAAVLPFALKEGLDVFFLTPKISQHKIVVESLAGISRKFGIRLKYIDLVGKRNLCINQKINSMEKEAFYKSCETLVKNRKCRFYSASKDPSNITAELADSALMGHNEFFRASFAKEVCAYEAATYLAKDSNIIIADYTHLLSPYTRGAFLKKISHNVGNAIVIWDEAHNILESASSYVDISISTRTISNASAELSALGSSIDLGYLDFALNEIAAKKLNGKKEAFVSGTDIPDLLKENLDDLAEKLEKAGLEFITNSGAKRSSLMHLAKFLPGLKSSSESVVLIISKNERGVSLSLVCLYPDASVLSFKEAYANVFMSGTLLPLSMYRELFGMEDAYTANYLSPFPKENKLSLVDREVSTKYEERSEENYKKMAEKIDLIRMSVSGNLAVFFPSFSVLNAVKMHSRVRIGFTQGKEMNTAAVDRLISEFKKSSDSLLFAVMGGSLSEGIDYPNNIIKGIIIVGIPLTVPDLKLSAKIGYLNRRFSGKGTEYAYTTPGVIRAVQAAGRAVRSGSDRAFIIFMDKRYNWGTYRSVINNFVEISESTDYIDSIRNFTGSRSMSHVLDE